MKTYKVLVSYRVGCVYEVEARDEIAAIEIALQMDEENDVVNAYDPMDGTTEADIISVSEEDR